MPLDCHFLNLTIINQFNEIAENNIVPANLGTVKYIKNHDHD